MLWVLIAQTKDAILRARELEYARYGISNERRAVLTIIQNSGGRAGPVDIARDLFRELHSVTEMLVRMEKDGLVTRHKGTGRSRVEVSLTEKGLDVFHQSLQVRDRRQDLQRAHQEAARAPLAVPVEAEEPDPGASRHPRVAPQLSDPAHGTGHHRSVIEVSRSHEQGLSVTVFSREGGTKGAYRVRRVFPVKQHQLLWNSKGEIAS